jgi:hypothetical protein
VIVAVVTVIVLDVFRVMPVSRVLRMRSFGIMGKNGMNRKDIGELACCPWCGVQAAIKECDLNYYQIGCFNNGCWLQPRAGGKWLDIVNMIFEWNSVERKND